MKLNTIYQGDCLTLLPTVADQSVDLILCDLPYGVTARNKWDEVIPLDPLWREYKRILKPNGAIILTAQQPFTTTLIQSNPKWFRYSLIWHKTTPTGFLNANRMPLRAHEDILVFYQKLPTYHPQKTSGHTRKVSTTSHKRQSQKSLNYGDYTCQSYDSTERFPTSVLTFSTDKQKEALHPTQKPIKLWEWLIASYTNPGDVVLDNCSGSFTTSVACDNLDRQWLAMEQEASYCEVGLKRVNDHRLSLNLPPVTCIWQTESS